MPAYNVVPTMANGDIPDADDWDILRWNMQRLYEGNRAKSARLDGPIDTTSTSFADIHASLTLNLSDLDGKRVKCILTCNAAHLSINQPVYFTVAVDGVSQAHATRGIFQLNDGDNVNTWQPVTLLYLTDALTGDMLSFKPRWRVGTGTGRLYNACFSVQEVG